MEAQQVYPVQLTGFTIPPRSLDLSVYSFERSQDLSFTAQLNDPVEPFRDVRLNLTIENGNSIIYQTDPNFSAPPIRLNQFQPETFDGVALGSYLNPMSLVGPSGLGQGSTIVPEGYNSICLEVIDIQRNVPISRKVCLSGSYVLNQPPQLLLPACGDQKEFPETQNLLFTWTPMHIGSQNSPNPVEYEFQLVELSPGIQDPNDGFEAALQIYQTTTISASLLYSISEPMLEPNKVYAWRVKAYSLLNQSSLLFENDGYSPVCTFSFFDENGGGTGSGAAADQEEDSRPIPQGCEVFSTDFGPISAAGEDPMALVEGDNVKLGYFDMEILDASPSGDGVSGTAFVTVPFLKAKFPVNFTDLKVKENMRAYGAGNIEVNVESDFQLDPTMLTPGLLGSIISEDYVDNLESFFLNGMGQNRLTFQFNPSDLAVVNLPIGVDKENNEEALPMIAILGLRFTERNAFMNCVGFHRLENGDLMRFAGTDISITPLGIKSNSKLDLLESAQSPLSGIFQLSIKAGNNASNIGMDCQGTNAFNLETEILISEEVMVRASDQQAIRFQLSDQSNDPAQYLGDIETFEDFTIPSLPGFEFSMEKGQLDLNTEQKLEITNPNPFHAEANENNWQGLLLNEVQVTLPTEFDFTGNDQNFQLEQGELFLSEEGAFGKFSGTGLVSIADGRMADWPYSVDLFDLEIKKGSPESSSISGKIQVPLLDEPFDYTANLDISDSDVKIEANPSPGAYNMSMWNATFEVEEGTEVIARLEDLGDEGKSFFPSASLKGNLSFSFDEKTFADKLTGDQAEKMLRIRQAFSLKGDLDIELKDLALDGLVIDPFAGTQDKYALFDFGTGADSIQIAGKAISITDLNILYKNDPKQELGLELKITERYNELNLIIWAQEDGQGGFIFNRIETSTKKVECDCVNNEDIFFDPTKLNKYLEKHYEKFYAPGKPKFSDYSVGGSYLPSGFSQEELDELHKTAVMAHLQQNSINGFVVDDINNVSEIYIPFLGATIAIKQDKAVKSDLIKTGLTDLTLTKVDDHELGSSGAWELPYDLTGQIDEFLNKNETSFPLATTRLLLTDLKLPPGYNSTEIGAEDEITVEITLVVKIPGSSENSYLIFTNDDVKIGAYEVGFEDLKLFLLEDKSHPFYNSEPDPEAEEGDVRNYGITYLSKKTGNTYNEDLSTGSYAFLKCEGFQYYNVQGMVTLPYYGEDESLSLNTLKKLNKSGVVGESLYLDATFPFTINGPDLSKFIAPLNTNYEDGTPVNFEINGLEFKTVTIDEGYFDFNPDESAEGFTGDEGDSFKGLALNKIQVEFDGLMTKEGDQRKKLKLPGNNFAFSFSNGISGNINMSANVITKEANADLGGWPYTITSLMYGMFTDNELNAADVEFSNEDSDGLIEWCSMKGTMLIPIFKDLDYNWVAFNGELNGLFWDSENTQYYPTGVFDLGDDANNNALDNQTFAVDWVDGLSLKLEDSTIDIIYNRNIGEFEAAAVLNGTAGIYNSTDEVDQGNSTTFNFGLSFLAFEGLSINVSESNCGSDDALGGIRDIDFGVWGLASYDLGGDDDEDDEEEEAEDGMQGFPVSLEALQFNCTKPGSWSLIIGLKLNLVPGETVQGEGDEEDTETAGLSATAQLNYIFNKNDKGELVYSDFWLDAIYVEGEFASMSVNGALVFIKEDDLYGNGVKGYLDVELSSMGLQLQVLAQFGTTKADNKNGEQKSAYRYFFFDIEFVQNPGVLVGPLPIAWHGLSGGIFFNCDAQTPVDDIDPFADQDKINAGTIMTPTVTTNTNLAVECPFGELCDPGVGLSLYNYEPSLGSMGLHLGVILSLSNKPETMVGELKVGAEFYINPLTSTYKINAIDINGALYFSSEDIFKRAEAPVVATVDLKVDFENKEIRGAFNMTIDYGAPDDEPTVTLATAEGGVNGALHFTMSDHPDAGKWYFKLGAPLEPGEITMALVDVFEAPISFYLQLGHDLDPIPTIKDIIPHWPDNGTAEGRLSDTFFSTGDGIVFGLKLGFSSNPSFGPFYANVDAAIGFDLSMMRYDDAPPECGLESFGINNWYIRGNGYAYIEGSMGIKYDLGFTSGQAEIFKGFAAVAIKTELPNPTYFNAQVYVSYEVLGGLIKGSCNFEFEEGEQIALDCLSGGMPSGPAELGIPIIGSTYPEEGDNGEAPPVFVTPQASFNLAINEEIQFPVYNEDFVQERIDRYKPVLNDFYLTKKGSSERIDGKLNQSAYQVSLDIDDLLEAESVYILHIKYEWQKREGADENWETVEVEGVSTEEHEEIEFTTDNFPTEMVDSEFKLSQPADGQHFWTKDYAIPMIEFEQGGWEQLFPAKSEKKVNGETIVYDYMVQVTEYNKTTGKETGNVYSLPLTEYPGMVAYETEKIKSEKIYLDEAGVNVYIPIVEIVSSTGEIVEFEGLNELLTYDGNKIYKLEIMRVPVQKTAEVMQEDNAAAAQLFDEDGNPIEESGDFTILGINTTSLAPSSDLYGEIGILYEMWFCTSKEEKFSEKVEEYFKTDNVNVEVSNDGWVKTLNHPLQEPGLSKDLGVEINIDSENPLGIDSRYLESAETGDDLGRVSRYELNPIVLKPVVLTGIEGFDEFDLIRLNTNFNQASQFKAYQQHGTGAFEDTEEIEDKFFSDNFSKIEDLYESVEKARDNLILDYIDTHANDGGTKDEFMAALNADDLESSNIPTWAQYMAEWLLIDDNFDNISWNHNFNSYEEFKNHYTSSKKTMLWLTCHNYDSEYWKDKMFEAAKDDFIDYVDLTLGVELDALEEAVNLFSLFMGKPEDLEGWSTIVIDGGLARFSITDPITPSIIEEGSETVQIDLYRPSIIAKQFLAYGELWYDFGNIFLSILDLYLEEISWTKSIGFYNSFSNVLSENFDDFYDWYDNAGELYDVNDIVSHNHKLILKFPNIDRWNYTHEAIDPNAYDWHTFTYEKIFHRSFTNTSGVEKTPENSPTGTSNGTAGSESNDLNPIKLKKTFNLIKTGEDKNGFTEAIELEWDEHLAEEYGIESISLAYFEVFDHDPGNGDFKLISYVDVLNEEEDIYDSDGNRYKVFYDAELNAPLFHYVFDDHKNAENIYVCIVDKDGEVVNASMDLLEDLEESPEIVDVVDFPTDPSAYSFFRREKLLRFPRNLENNPLQMLMYSMGTRNDFEVEAVSIYDDQDKRLLLWRGDVKTMYSYIGDSYTAVEEDFVLQTEEGSSENHILFEMDPDIEYTVYVKSDEGMESFVTDNDYWINRGGASVYRFDDSYPDAVFLPVDGNNALNFEAEQWVDLTGNNGDEANGLELGLPILNMTIEAWVKFGSGSVTDAPILSFDTGNNPWSLRQNGSDIEFELRTLPNNEKNIAIASNLINTGDWTHLAATYDGKTMRLYVNGLEEASIEQTGLIDYDMEGYLKLGGYNFEGAIDEVSLWTTVRSQAEILVDAAEGPYGLDPDYSQEQSGLLLYYKFDENLGDTEFPNLSGTGQNGILEKEFDHVTGNNWVASEVPRDMGIDTEEIANDVAPGNFALEYKIKNHRVQLPTNMMDEITNDFTVEFWAKSGDSGDGERFEIIRQYGLFSIYTYDNGRFLFDHGDEKIEFGEQFINDGSWHHYALSGEGGNIITLYRDGIQLLTLNSDFEIENNDTDLFIGYLVNANNLSLDELSFWSIARTGEQIYEDFLSENLLLNNNLDHLVAYYDFNDGSGQELVSDRSGNEHHASFYNSEGSGTPAEWEIEWIEGAEPSPNNYIIPQNPSSNYAMSFLYDDGISSITVNDHEKFDEIQEELTIQFWAKSSDDFDDWSTRFAYKESFFSIWIKKSNRLTYYNHDGKTSAFSEGSFINDGNWHHYAIIAKNENEWELYQDGQLFEEITEEFEFVANDEDLKIGLVYINESSASLDELIIWTTARTAQEIEDYYNTGSISLENKDLLAYYAFNDGPGSTFLSDQSGNHLHGEISYGTHTIPEYEDEEGNLIPEKTIDSEEWIPGATSGGSTTPPISIPLYSLEKEAAGWRPVFKDATVFSDVEELSIYSADRSLFQKWYSSEHKLNSLDTENPENLNPIDWIQTLLPELDDYSDIYLRTKSGHLYHSTVDLESDLLTFTLDENNWQNTPYEAGDAAEEGSMKLDRISNNGQLTGKIQLTYRNSRPVTELDVAIYNEELERQTIYFSGEEKYREYTFSNSGGQNINLRDWDGLYHFNLTEGDNYTIFLRNESDQYLVLNVNDEFWEELSVFWFDADDFETAANLAAYFDIGDYALEMEAIESVSLPTIPFGNEWTIEGWMHLETPSAYSCLFRLSFDGTYYGIYKEENEIETDFGNESNWNYSSIENEWIHLAVTYENETLSTFLNGEKIGTILEEIIIPATNTNSTISYPSGSSLYKNCRYDDFAIWNYARNEEKVQESYLYGIDPNTAGLIAFYNFNDGPGSSRLTDISVNGHHGTLSEYMENMSDWVPSDKQPTDYDPGPYTLQINEKDHPELKYLTDDNWYDIAQLYLRNTDGSHLLHWFDGYLFELESESTNFACGDIPYQEALLDSSDSYELFLKTVDGEYYYIEDTNASSFQLLEELDPEDERVPNEMKEGVVGSGSE